MSRAETFRANVGIVLINGDGLVFACERADVLDAWQLPQGGLDSGEEPLAGALRELREETGIGGDAVAMVAEHPDWLAYELPPEYRRTKLGRGQVQKWFLFRFEGDPACIDLDEAETREFRAWRWMRLGELAEDTVPFRRPIYRRLAEDFAEHLA